MTKKSSLEALSWQNTRLAGPAVHRLMVVIVVT